jgi:hypothetical protein
VERRLAPSPCRRRPPQDGRLDRSYRVATVEWPAELFGPFFNANTIDDLAAAQRFAAIDELA